MTKFPVLSTIEYIPLEVLIPHEKQALKNHGQTLQRLAERGGMDYMEILCVLEDKEPDWKRKMDNETCRNKVLKIVNDFNN